MINQLPLLPAKEQTEQIQQKEYYLEKFNDEIHDSEDEFEFEEVMVEAFEDDSDIEESLDQAVRNINENSFFAFVDKEKEEESVPTLTNHPEVIDDFIRNYLSKKGLLKALEAFQIEWYEFQQKGQLAPEDVQTVPDIYLQNQQFADSITKLRIDVDCYKQIAEKARATYDKLRKERDFHRMHHKRVVQEKNKLISDIKKLKKHYENYEPTIKQLQHKYEIAMKEKMLTKLERDRIATKQTAEKKESTKQKQTEKKPKENTLPTEDRINPYLKVDLPVAKVEKFKLHTQIKAHSLPIGSMKLHPKKQVLSTVSDDRTWKLWALPTGELIMSGEGHKDWIADCDFHPKGNQLATASGDFTVKLWDFSKGISTLTLSDHTRAVWSCAFHDNGDFLVSGSMDQTCKLWDITIGKCKQTFRGHADSVNYANFQPFTNTVFTCSSDKTISFWDGRSGLCAQTFFGHFAGINQAAFSLKGNSFASCDANGSVKLWDIRNIQEIACYETGQHANKLNFDPSGNILAVASNDGVVRLLNVQDESKSRELKTHEESAQSVIFDKSAENLLVGGYDGQVRIFQ